MDYMDEVKFRMPSEVVLFDVMQRHGRLSVDELSRHAKLARTTSYQTAKRLKARGLFDYQAVPRLSQFSEVPMMVLGFQELTRGKLRTCVGRYAQHEQVRMLLHDRSSALVLLMHESASQLNSLATDIMNRLGRTPVLSMHTPSIAKLKVTIPASVLHAVYGTTQKAQR